MVIKKKVKFFSDNNLKLWRIKMDLNKTRLCSSDKRCGKHVIFLAEKVRIDMINKCRNVKIVY